jgi:hypothetical protein
VVAVAAVAVDKQRNQLIKSWFFIYKTEVMIEVRKFELK